MLLTRPGRYGAMTHTHVTTLHPNAAASLVVSNSIDPLPVLSCKRPNPIWRQLYALLSVSLAVFLFSVIATAAAFHGFQFGQSSGPNANRDSTAPTAHDVDTAASEYQHRRSATVAALADYNNAKARLDDYVSEQLSSISPEETEISATQGEPTQETGEPSTVDPTAVANRQIEDRYHQLQSQVTQAQQKCLAALNRSGDAWQRKIQLISDKAVADRTAALRIQTSSLGDGPLRATILWCSLLAMIVGAFVCASATANEQVFETAADVRQNLGLTVLGLLPRLAPVPSDQPRREPSWVKHCIRASEFCLLALALGIAVLCVSDSQFFTKFLADPVAAVGQKLWC
jgi:hypothetical protein